MNLMNSKGKNKKVYTEGGDLPDESEKMFIN